VHAVLPVPRRGAEPDLAGIAAPAADLLAWTARLALPAHAASYEPKRLRLRILAVAGRIVHTPAAASRSIQPGPGPRRSPPRTPG